MTCSTPFLNIFFQRKILHTRIRIECYDGWLPGSIREPSRLAQVPLPAFYKRL